ncbi:HupE/UreJ family protein [Candidatus Phycosocius spiralis]|nr:HupE/UreJ family protein [Candidatus Phycosocius spiralis]
MLFWLALLFALPATADEFKPAYLQLIERGGGYYDVLWKVPALDESKVLKLQPVFPPGTRDVTPHSGIYARGATVQRWRIAVPGGLTGRDIGFAGLALVPVDVLVRMARSDGTEQLERLNPANPVFTAAASPGPWEVVSSYTLLGIEHIWQGIDHLLFVAGLVMLVDSRRKLLLTITAFTIAHSITLALATLGVLKVPGPPVEAIIALSIVFVAAEILHRQQGRTSLAVRKPWLIAFSFGLLHGLGFAGALAEVGLPQNSIPLALLFFNVGVEIGQLLFVAALLAAAALVRRVTGPTDPRWAAVLPAYAIGGIASYWMFERVAAFF